MTQLLFNNGNQLDLNDLKFSDEERIQIKDAAKEMLKSLKDMSDESKANLKKYWQDNAEASRRVVDVLRSFCPANCKEDSESFVAVKEAMIKSMVLEEVIKRIQDHESKSGANLNRLPGETESEHKARLKAYLSE